MPICHTNSSLLVAYLNESYTESRNPRNSLSFIGDTLNSYNSILSRINRADKVLFINYNLIGYSVTTTAHISSLKTFCDDYQIFTILFDKQPLQVVRWYWDSIIELIRKYLRATTRKPLYQKEIHALLSEVERYVDYMQLDR